MMGCGSLDDALATLEELRGRRKLAVITNGNTDLDRLGLGGMFDLEPIGGPPRQEIGFDQTLHAWGLPDGPYLMLPFAGPSTPRDLAGDVGDGLLNPLSWAIPLGGNLGRTVALGLDERERNGEALDDIRSNSLDPYARLRSLWRQNRDAKLGRATAEAPEVLDDPETAAGGR